MKTKFLAASLIAATTTCARADMTPQELPMVQDWSGTNQLAAENDWSGVPGFIGYRGDRLTAKPGLNPESVTADGATSPTSAMVNQRNPNALRTGGVAEFDTLPDPVVAFKGSATASAPSLVLNVTTLGKKNIAVGYKLRDVDGSANNAVQAVAFQYRVGTNGSYIDLPAAFTADASTGPSLATHVTPVVALLPADVDDKPVLQFRWVTANADGNDEWVGVDDITVIGDPIAPPPAAAEPAKTSGIKESAKPVRSPRDAANP